MQEVVLPGIHDRFLRDEQFRSRMIENGRDEDASSNGCSCGRRSYSPFDTHKNITTLQQLKKERRRSSKKSTMGTEFFFLYGGVGKVLGGLFIPMKVTMEKNQVMIEQGDLLYKYLETILQGMIFLHSFTLLVMDRLQLTAV